MHEGRPYLVMEYVAGGTLADRLRGTPQPPDEAARLMTVLARAVQAAHDQHIVHRDLKPSNILLQKTEDRRQKTEDRRQKTEEQVAGARDSDFCLLSSDVSPKIADFSLARRLDQEVRLTGTGQVMGTPSYMAPEQAAGRSHESGALVDVYALGAILYELLTGRPPFVGVNAVETVFQVLRQEVVPPRRLRPAVPMDLQTICLKCLSEEPARRYASAQALAEDLDRFLRGQPIQARPVSRFERVAKWVRRHPAVSALTAVLLLVTVAGVGGIVWKWQDEARARGDADNARLAETRAHEATAEALRNETMARQEADRRRIESDRRLLNLNLEKHLGLCERGQADLGLLGLTRDLAFARSTLPEESDDLQSILRLNVSLWRLQFHALKAVFPGEGAGTLGGLNSDGNFYWTREPENGVRQWAVESGRPWSPVLKHDGPVRDLAVSADGQVIVTAAGRSVRSWAAVSGKPLGPALEHPADVERVVLSPDGTTALTTCADNKVRLWGLPEGKAVGEPVPLAGAIRGAVLSPDGRWAVTWDDHRNARLLDLTTGAPVGGAMTHPGAIHCAAFSPNGKTLALGGGNIFTAGPVQLWPTEGGKPAGPLLRHSTAVESVAFSPDGRTVATGSYDRTARLWDVATGKPLGEPLRHAGLVGAVGFSPDGRTLATATFSEEGRRGVVRLWDVASSSPIGPPLAHPKVPSAVIVRSGGTTLCSACDDGHVRLWDISPWRTTGFPAPHPNGVAHVAFADGGTALTVGREGAWRLLSPITGRSLGPGGRFPDGHMPLALAPGGHTGVVALIGTPGPARLWEVATNRLVGEPLAPVGLVLPSAVFSADGKKLLTNSEDGTARLWDAASGKPLGEPLTHGKAIHAVALSPDGKTALTTGPDGFGRLWDLATGKSLGTAFEPEGAVALFEPGGHFAFAAFLPGGRGFLTTDFKGNARMRDASGRPVALPGAGAKVVTISPDGTLAVTEAVDRTVRLWDVVTGRAVGPALLIDLPAARAIPGASPDEVWPHWYFSPDGRALAARRHNKAWLWPVPPPAPGGPDDLGAWAEALTGLRLRDDETAEPLDAVNWRARRRQAEAARLP